MIPVIFALVIVGVALFLVRAYIPMDPVIATLIQVLIVLAVVWYLLGLIGFVPITPFPIRR